MKKLDFKMRRDDWLNGIKRVTELCFERDARLSDNIVFKSSGKIRMSNFLVPSVPKMFTRDFERLNQGLEGFSNGFLSAIG